LPKRAGLSQQQREGVVKIPHKAFDVMRLGLHSLTVHKARSLLTSLGIVIGVLSVIAMLAINEGFSYESQRALREMGSDNIIIESIKPPSDESKATESSRGLLQYGLTHQNVRTLLDNVPGMIQGVAVHRTIKYAQVRDRRLSVAVIGTEPTYVDVARIEITRGRFLTTADMLRAKPHCVITDSLARRLLAYHDPIGKTMVLGGEPFVIVGTLARLPRTLAGTASDVGNYVIIPLTADSDRFGEHTIMLGQGGGTFEKVEVSQLIMQMQDEQAVLDGAAVARSVLERTHEQQDFDVTVPLELIAQREKQRRLWNFMFVAIASISLIVGGIGIMNIMLASVTERTREIGIRRALGAKKRDVVTQFLIESVTLTTAGGLAGIGLGMLIPYLVSSLLALQAIVTPLMVLLPFIMAVSVGLISGLYPAVRAAALDPIVALRHE
jgi:putative ABC transport system permease protein